MDFHAPEHDSPHHILNALNDDCIEAIFRQLTALEDLLNAAYTCRRFRELAKRIRPMLKSISIDKGTGFSTMWFFHNVDIEHYINIVPADRAPMFLRDFGHLTESLAWEPHRSQQFNDDMFELIVKFCSKTLSYLSLRNCNPKIDKTVRFDALQHIELISRPLIDFSLDSPLKYVQFTEDISELSPDNQSIQSQDQPWFIRSFPNLKEINFDTNQLTDDTLEQFLALNQQLSILHFEFDCRTTPAMLESIGNYCQDINYLYVAMMFPDLDIPNVNLMHLGKLRKLSSLHIYHNAMNIETLMKVLVENDVPLESLSCAVWRLEQSHSFMTLTTLTDLYMSIDGENSGDILINFIKSQTALKSVSIFNSDQTVTVHQIGKMLQAGKNLSKFDFDNCYFDIDLQNYEMLKNLALNRVNVHICISEDNRLIDIPEDVLSKNSRWIRVTNE